MIQKLNNKNSFLKGEKIITSEIWTREHWLIKDVWIHIHEILNY